MPISIVSAAFFRHPKDGDCRGALRGPVLVRRVGPSEKDHARGCFSACRQCRLSSREIAEQDSERSLSLPNLLLLTSILTLFSFGVATKALILAISSPLCVASSCVLNFAAAMEHNTINSSTCTRDIACLTHCSSPAGTCAFQRGQERGKTEKG